MNFDTSGKKDRGKASLSFKLFRDRVCGNRVCPTLFRSSILEHVLVVEPSLKTERKRN